MNRLLAILALVASLGITQASDRKDSLYESVSLNDIIMLTQRGVSEATILVFLQNREIGFIPGADDIDLLLKAGVSEAVIRYMIQQTAPTPIYTNNLKISTNPYPTYYVDPYPAYYYTPYYTRASLYFGYSVFSHVSFGHNRHIVAPHYRPHYTTSLHLARNIHNASRFSHSNSHRVINTGGHRSGSGIFSAGHRTTGVGIRMASAGHIRSGSISHGSRSAGHLSRSAGHLSRSAGHSSLGSIGHQRSGGHSGSFGGGHYGGGGHGGGGHGGGRGSGH